MNREERIRYLSGLILASLLVSLAVLHVTDESVQQRPGKPDIAEPDIAEPDIVMCRILDEARGTLREEPMAVTSAAMRKACERGAAVFIVPDIEIEKLPAAAPQPWEIHEQEARD